MGVIIKGFAFLGQSFYTCEVTECVWYLNDYVSFLSVAPQDRSYA